MRLLKWLLALSVVQGAGIAEAREPGPAAATQPVAAPAPLCGLPPTSHRIGNRLVIDAQRDHPPVPLVYRVDDANGFVVYPSTTANGIVLSLPDSLGNPIYLSIAQKQDADGNDVVCSPQPSGVTIWTGPKATPPVQTALDPATTVSNPSACAEPFRDGRVRAAAVPRMPIAAQTQGITGVVSIAVVLNSDGSVADTKIIETPSHLLDASALQAARSTTYEPAIFRCAAVPAVYVFAVGYGRR